MLIILSSFEVTGFSNVVDSFEPKLSFVLLFYSIENFLLFIGGYYRFTSKLKVLALILSQC